MLVAASILLVAGPARADEPTGALAAAMPTASLRALELALTARRCAAAAGVAALSERMAVIDYSLPSTEPRMWVIDVAAGKLLYAEHVAHGRNSGGNLAHAFSNDEGSLQSSLGLFRAADTYEGGNGYSLRLDGLDPGINDSARRRQIVIHGAPYVDPERALLQGRLGRSFGCPAVRPAVARQIIDTLRGGQLVFAYYPDPVWLTTSRNLACGTPLAQSVGAAVPGDRPAVRAAVASAP